YSLLVKYGKAGTAQYWEELGGKWAVPGYDTKKYSSLEEADAAEDSYGYQIIKVLDKILQMPKEIKKEEKVVEKKIIVALDAGHGMKTAGKRCLKRLDSNETREWWLNDRIADRLQELLADYDCAVIRCGDTTGTKDVSLSSRVKTANSAAADVFISIHHNAGLKGKSGGGTVVFYSSSKPERPEQSQRLYDAVVDRTGLRGNRSQTVVKKGFYVVKNTTMPGFLIENGFMDSPDDVPVILSAEHAEKTAQGILDFLVAEFSLCRNAQVQENTVPAETAAEPQDNTAMPYTIVNKGDTLSSIARKFDLTWKDLAEANEIKSPYTIHAGNKIYLPIDKDKILCYPAYTGKKTTLAAALSSLGITSTYSFRKQIAAANGVTAYLGTASQNTAMYNLLTAGLLKRAQ
ncbi:MAG: N-acetylmuramoyl-L-alanine amidase, partial [Butyrivibrio sp.]|nr:N-acetylmuramoyl-L-alanine amidase [Acetatifactor muris]MCM1561243.1 N-acetylmuramoyl-L-alanine amidase [Butyrivibrio sp.]